MLVDLMCEDQGHSPEQRLVLATIAKLESDAQWRLDQFSKRRRRVDDD
jgi:hypothetical protein